MKTLKKYKKHLQTRKKYAIIYKHEINRGVAQLVARVVWDHEAAGSNPVTRTTGTVRSLYGGIAQLVRAHGSHP